MYVSIANQNSFSAIRNKASTSAYNLMTYYLFFPVDFTSVNSFQEDVKFSSPSFYNLTPPPPPTSRPPPYEVQNFSTPTKTPPSNTPVENYYAATDIVKVRLSELRFAGIKSSAGMILYAAGSFASFFKELSFLLNKTVRSMSQHCAAYGQL